MTTETFPWPDLEPSLSEWGLKLDEKQRALLERYLAFIAEANHRTNLTAEADADSLLLRHAADGLAAAAVLRLMCPAPPKVLDVGTGAGFIGISLKIAWPEAEVWLLESLQRKYDVLNRAAVLLGLKGLRPVRARAEAASSLPAFDVVLERALAHLPEALDLCLPHVKPGGRFLAFQSDRPDMDDTKLKKALARRGARLIESWPYRLPREDKDRFLAVFAAGGETQGDH